MCVSVAWGWGVGTTQVKGATPLPEGVVEGMTPLHAAVSRGHERVLAILLSSKARVNQSDVRARW
jgi:hypothetical protein